MQEVSANEATFLLLRGRLLLLRALDYASMCPLNTKVQEKLQLEQYYQLRHALDMFMGTGLPLYAISNICPWKPWYRPEAYMYLHLLMCAGATKVSRHEDIFYALRPLARRDLFLPEPLYGQTKVEVHKKHTAAFIRMGSAAAILQHAGIAWCKDPGMPSWCPDFGPETARTTLNGSISQLTLLVSEGMPQAVLSPSPSTSKYFEFSEPSLEVLIASASFECSLGCLSDGDPPASYPEFDVMTSYRWVSSVRSRIKTQVTRSFSSFIREELVELADNDWRLNLEQQAINLSHFDLAFRTLLAPLYPRVFEDEIFRKRVDSQCIKRILWLTELNYKLAVTDNGLLGLVPNICQPKDRVVLFPGSWVPVIIRKSDIDKTYQVIGDAFILNLRGKEYEVRDGRTFEWSEFDYETLFFDLKDEELTEITLV